MDIFLLLTFLSILGIVLWALLGKGEGKGKRKEAEDEAEKLFRRRASDKVIEDEFPDERRNQLKRKTDIPPEAVTGEPDEDFQLPYLTDDIISERSRFKVYKRTVINSEIYAKKGDYNTAISLYQGVNKRINDKNVNSKINANIDYLRNYQKSATEKKKETASRERSGSKPSEIKFTIDGPFKLPEKIQIDLATLGRGTSEPKIDLEKMADDIVGKLVDKKLIPSDSKKLLEGYQAEIESLKDKLGKSKAARGLPGAEAESEALQQITGKILDKVDGLYSDVKNLKNEMSSHYEAGTPEQITEKALSQTEKFNSRIQDLKNEMNQLSGSGLIGKPTGKALNQLDDLQSKVQDLKNDMSLFARSGVPAKKIVEKTLPEIEGLEGDIQNFRNEIGSFIESGTSGIRGLMDEGAGPIEKATGKMLNQVEGIQSEVKNIKDEMSHHREAGTSGNITGRALNQIAGLQPPVQNLKNQLKQFAESGLSEKSPHRAINQVDGLQSGIQNIQSGMNRLTGSGAPPERIIDSALPQIDGIQGNIRNLKDEISQIAESGPSQTINNKMRFDDELKKIKNDIDILTKGKTADLDTQQEIDKYKSEVDRLQDNIGQLMDFKDKTEKEKLSDKPVDQTDMGTIKEVIKNLNDRIEQLSEKEKKTREELQDVKTYNRAFTEGLLRGKPGPDDEDSFDEASLYEADKKPSLAEAKFKAPGKEAPAARPVTLPGKKEAVPEKEKPDFELLSEYGKEEEEEFSDASDSLSDDDIFDKILSGDEKKKEEDSFEILGYKKEEKEKEFGYDIEDAEVERKRMEEEKFYRKFLKYDKRKKKELPILKVSYDFTKLPDDFSLSRDKNILEYSFYKYKGMLEKANELIKTRNVKDAINYYKVVLSQNIPFEFKSMLRKNINELTEYIEKYLSAD